MKSEKNLKPRLAFLARVVQGEVKSLSTTNQRLFANPFTSETAAALAENIELAERTDAFVARFSRLQDTLGDKLLPTLLKALGEDRPTLVDRLDLAEKMGWIESSEDWMTMRQLRNQMIHEYIEDPYVLATALQTGHEYVKELTQTANRMLEELHHRGWLTQAP